jgi:hypothetical protein
MAGVTMSRGALIVLCSATIVVAAMVEMDALRQQPWAQFLCFEIEGDPIHERTLQAVEIFWQRTLLHLRRRSRRRALRSSHALVVTLHRARAMDEQKYAQGSA